MPQNRPLTRKMEDSKGHNDSQTGEKRPHTRQRSLISLLNTERKILEKLLINRIQHHLYTTDTVNGNQFGSTTQNMVDAVVEVRQFIDPHLEVVIIPSLGVQGAFASARCPTILIGLTAADYPRNLY